MYDNSRDKQNNYRNSLLISFTFTTVLHATLVRWVRTFNPDSFRKVKLGRANCIATAKS